MVYQMIRIGEEAGSTEEMLDKIADYYDEEVEMEMQSLMAALGTYDYYCTGNRSRRIDCSMYGTYDVHVCSTGCNLIILDYPFCVGTER